MCKAFNCKILYGRYAANIHTYSHTHTRSRPFIDPLSATTGVGRYQKGKTKLDFTEARDSEWQWYQLGRMQDCTSLQTDNHASTPTLSFFTGWMPFLPPNQQRQSSEGSTFILIIISIRSLLTLVSRLKPFLFCKSFPP